MIIEEEEIWDTGSDLFSTGRQNTEQIKSVQEKTEIMWEDRNWQVSP